MYPDVDAIEYLLPQNIFFKWHCPVVPSRHQRQLKWVPGWLPQKDRGNESLQGISWLGFPLLALSCPRSEGSIKAKELSRVTSLLKTLLVCACSTAVFYLSFPEFLPSFFPYSSLLHPWLSPGPYAVRWRENIWTHPSMSLWVVSLSATLGLQELQWRWRERRRWDKPGSRLVLSTLIYEVYAFPCG